LQRNLSDITIEIGDAPELGYTFGANKVKNKLVLAKWLENVQPEITRRKIWEFIIIRESMSFFFSDELLKNQISELSNLFLNIIAMSYLQKMYEGKSFESEFQILKGKFLYESDDKKESTLELENQINYLLTIVVNQNITHKLIYNTYLHFIEDIPLDEVDADELINDFQRYLSSSAEEIAAPIQFKDSVMIVINELINIGHNATAVEIAKNLRMNHSTVTKHLIKIVSRYNAYWRREYNWKKMGVHTYFLLIEISKENDSVKENITKEIQEIPYIFELLEGENIEFHYLYAVFHCPHSTADNLTFALEKKLNDKTINAFEVKPIQRRVYKTAFVHPKIKPTIANYEKLLAGKTPIQKFVSWDSKDFETESIEFVESDYSLLKFMSILLNKSITTKGYFGVWLKELEGFFVENNVDPNDTLEGTNLFNKLQKTAISKKILDYRLSISPSILYSHEKLVIKIICNPDSDSTYRLIDDLSIFGWIGIMFSYEEVFLVINGLKHNDSVTKLIKSFLEEKKLEYELFSAKSIFSRFVPFNELYDYKNKKWKL